MMLLSFLTGAFISVGGIHLYQMQFKQRDKTIGLVLATGGLLVMFASAVVGDML